MKGIGKYAWLLVTLVALAGMLSLVATPLAAQTATPDNRSSAPNLNHNAAPCDYNDTFYKDNGIDPTLLVLRFGDNNGTTRLTGPPASGNQKNYVADPTCATNDPNRRNFRILATTGGNSDDNNSPFTCADLGPSASPGCANQPNIPETVEFINILAFLTTENNFLHTADANGVVYSRTVGFINGGLEGVQQNPGETILYTAAADGTGFVTGTNPRGFAVTDLVSNFEAYAAVKQLQPNGVFATNPCAADMQSPLAPPTPCFDVSTVQTVFTNNLRQDWRFATNRNSMDGSDNNDPIGSLSGSVNNTPFGYFCDDLLGMWILTYFWITEPPNTTDPVCAPIYAAIGKANGFDAAGGPIILTAHELNDELEANNCGAEGQMAVDGSDGGAAWLICPAIPDPRNGAITQDAFLDQVHNPNGIPQNLFLTVNFLSLQIFGVFPNELSSSQSQTVSSAVASTN